MVTVTGAPRGCLWAGAVAALLALLPCGLAPACCLLAVASLASLTAATRLLLFVCCLAVGSPAAVELGAD